MTSISVIVATRGNPRLGACLSALLPLASPSDEIIVVWIGGGASDHLVAVPGARFVDAAPGSTLAAARNQGAQMASGDIVAFVDDDLAVAPAWMDRIRAAYTNPRVVAAGGRVSEGQIGEAGRGIGDVGRLLANGSLTDHFAADPGRSIVVDHLPAANLSFRATALREAGGLADFPDAGRYAEADLCLRVGGGERVLVFDPTAVGMRAPAPLPTSRRLSVSDLYQRAASHSRMIVRSQGRGPMARTYLCGRLVEQRLRLIEALMLTTPYWGRADGSRRPWRRRADAPLPLLYAATEVAGLLTGLLTQRRTRATGHGHATR